MAFEDIKKIATEIDLGRNVISISGLTSSAVKAFFLTELQRLTGRSFAIVATSNAEADTLAADLVFWPSRFAEDTRYVASLPSFETDPYASISPHAETKER